MSNECTLTTVDNPYDPFEQFTSWLMFDKEKDYDTCEYLARLVQPRLRDDMTQQEENATIEAVIDEIMTNNPLGIYKKVWRNLSNNNETTEILEENVKRILELEDVHLERMCL